MSEPYPPPPTGSVFDRLVADGPQFHELEGQPISWHNHHPRVIEEHLRPGMRTLETGAGYSTVVFAGCGCDHLAITPAGYEAERIAEYCRRVGYRVPEFRIGSSAYELAKLEGELFDVVLIDGAHAFPYPIVDWFFAHRLLKQGGLVFIDDTDLMGCFIMARFLASDPNWEPVVVSGSLAVYRKLNAGHHHWDDWPAQPFSQTKVAGLETFLEGFWPEQGEALAAAAAAAARTPAEPLIVTAGRPPLRVVAFADELAAEPALLEAYARGVQAADGIELVVYAPDGEAAEAERVLAPLVEAAGLADAHAPEVVLLAVAAEAEAEERLAGLAACLFSRRLPTGAFRTLPRVDDRHVELLVRMAAERRTHPRAA